jgi:hypothetical protein
VAGESRAVSASLRRVRTKQSQMMSSPNETIQGPDRCYRLLYIELLSSSVSWMSTLIQKDAVFLSSLPTGVTENLAENLGSGGARPSICTLSRHKQLSCTVVASTDLGCAFLAVLPRQCDVGVDSHTLLSVFFIHFTCCSGVASMNSLACRFSSSCHALESCFSGCSPPGAPSLDGAEDVLILPDVPSWYAMAHMQLPCLREMGEAPARRLRESMLAA